MPNCVSTVFGITWARSASPKAFASSTRPPRSTCTTPEKPVRRASASTASASDGMGLAMVSRPAAPNRGRSTPRLRAARRGCEARGAREGVPAASAREHPEEYDSFVTSRGLTTVDCRRASAPYSEEGRWPPHSPAGIRSSRSRRSSERWIACSAVPCQPVAPKAWPRGCRPRISSRPRTRSSSSSTCPTWARMTSRSRFTAER